MLDSLDSVTFINVFSVRHSSMKKSCYFLHKICVNFIKNAYNMLAKLTKVVVGVVVGTGAVVVCLQQCYVICL
jgi:hypothetical protein